MSLNITIVGSADRQLEELLRSQSTRIRSMPVAELLALAQPAAPQPDVVVLDARESGALPPTLVTLKRQHPTTGVVIIAARMDPALMVEAMRAGVNEWLAEPHHAARPDAAIERVTSQPSASVHGQVFAFIGAKGGVGTTTIAVNVATALAQAVERRAHAADGLPLVLRRCGGVSRRRAALLRGRRDGEHAPARRGVLREPGRPQQERRRAPAGLGGARGRRRWTCGASRRCSQFAATHYRYTVLDVPRSEAAVLDSLEGVATHPDRRQPGAGHRAQRRPHRRRRCASGMARTA